LEPVRGGEWKESVMGSEYNQTVLYRCVKIE
jgi:hypothetical protein